jgi:oligopeptide transport system substrate-binding protein
MRLILLFIVTTLIACNKNKQAHSQFFYYNQPEGIATTDPAFTKSQPVMWIVHQLYNTLVELDDSMHIKPSIAHRWQISDDKKQFTFYLRDNIFFHDNEAFVNGKGRKLVAADVVYSLQRIMDKNTASSGAWIFNKRVDPQTGFVAINDSVFQLNLLKPFNPILGILTMQYCSILPREVVEKYGKDFRKHPCGTGPFVLKTWDEGQAMVLVKNNKYFERDKDGTQLPKLAGVQISFSDSRATEFLLFKQKKLDFINDIDPSFKDLVLTKTGKLKKEFEKQFVLNTCPYLNTEYLGINIDDKNTFLKQSPLAQKKIRQAINYGFDKEKLVFYMRNSLGYAALGGIIPSCLPSYNKQAVNGYNYNPAKAAQLLAEAGFPQGKNLPAIKLLTIPIYADIASFISKELLNIGIKIDVEVVQKASLIERASRGEALFFRASWIADYPDGENYLTMFYSSNPAPPNYTRTRIPAYDALYEQALAQPNDSLRYILYQQMENLVLENASFVPLWYDIVIHLVQPTIKNFKPNAANLLELRWVTK